MSGITLLLELWKRNPSLSTQSLHSYSLFSGTVAASAAAASITAGKPFPSRAIFGNNAVPIAYCDGSTSAAWSKEYTRTFPTASEHIDPKFTQGRIKEYPLKLKSLFSAFGIKSLAMTSLRSFLLFYLPLLEPRSLVEEEDAGHESSDEKPVDLITPFQNSVKQIIRETSVVTTRRVLQRLTVHYVSQRMAWKLLKDVPR